MLKRFPYLLSLSQIIFQTSP